VIDAMTYNADLFTLINFVHNKQNAKNFIVKTDTLEIDKDHVQLEVIAIDKVANIFIQFQQRRA
jgi:hypothetical protein